MKQSRAATDQRRSWEWGPRTTRPWCPRGSKGLGHLIFKFLPSGNGVLCFSDMSTIWEESPRG